MADGRCRIGAGDNIDFPEEGIAPAAMHSRPKVTRAAGRKGVDFHAGMRRLSGAGARGVRPPRSAAFRRDRREREQLTARGPFEPAVHAHRQCP